MEANEFRVCVDHPEPRALVDEMRRERKIVASVMLARFGWTTLERDRVGSCHEVEGGLMLCVHEIAAVTGLSFRKVRARIRAGLTGRALIEVDGLTAFDPGPLAT